MYISLISCYIIRLNCWLHIFKHTVEIYIAENLLFVFSFDFSNFPSILVVIMNIFLYWLNSFVDRLTVDSWWPNIMTEAKKWCNNFCRWYFFVLSCSVGDDAGRCGTTQWWKFSYRWRGHQRSAETFDKNLRVVRSGLLRILQNLVHVIWIFTTLGNAAPFCRPFFAYTKSLPQF